MKLINNLESRLIGELKRAINIAAKKKIPNKLWSVYIGVYSDEALNHILEIKSKFKCKVTLYNARMADIWEN